MADYACTDLHGRLDLYEKIRSILKPGDHVFFLGDAGDRGLDGWELIKSIYNDPQFFYVKGNHEDMLVDAIRAYLKNPEYESKAHRLLKRNGGEKTISDWWMDGADGEWAEKLEALPTHIEYTNQKGTVILMSHAGYTPWFDEEDPDKIIIPDNFELIWNRDHFYEDWDSEHFDHHVVVHGHTPILHLADYLLDKREDIPHGAYWYDNNRKVCIDNLSAFTGVVCLLNLNTFEEIVISDN